MVDDTQSEKQHQSDVPESVSDERDRYKRAFLKANAACTAREMEIARLQAILDRIPWAVVDACSKPRPYLDAITQAVNRSSLGTPEAVAARASVSDEDAARIVARSKEIDS